MNNMMSSVKAVKFRRESIFNAGGRVSAIAAKFNACALGVCADSAVWLSAASAEACGAAWSLKCKGLKNAWIVDSP